MSDLLIQVLTSVTMAGGFAALLVARQHRLQEAEAKAEEAAASHVLSRVALDLLEQRDEPAVQYVRPWMALSDPPPPPAHLDPRWEWLEIATLGSSKVEWVKGPCKHLEPMPVEAVTGEVVAYLCPDCDEQLPA